MDMVMIASILLAGITVHTANLETIYSDSPVVTNVSYVSDLPPDYTTTNAVKDIVVYKRDLTNNVCAADSFAYSAWSKENLPSGVTWDDQPTYDASIDLWEWSYNGGSAQSEEGGADATSLTFGYGEGFTSTRTAIKVAASNDTFTTYGFVTNAIANATPDLSSRTTFAQATNIAASVLSNNDYANVSNKAVNAVQYEEDKNGDKTAVTIGERDGSAPKGPGSIAIGGGGKATNNYSIAVGAVCYSYGEGSFAHGVNSTAFGVYSKAMGSSVRSRGAYSRADGVSTYSIGDYSHADGILAVTGTNTTDSVGHLYAYAWSADGTKYYYSHGDGTFNINPVGGLSGFYIGETNFADHVTNIVNSVADASVTAAVDSAMSDILGSNWKTTYGGGLAGLIAAIVAALTWMKNKRLDITTVCEEWSSSTTYAKGANVVYNGKFYTSKADSNTNHAPTDTTWWDVSTLFSSTNTSTDPQPTGVLNNSALDKGIVKVIAARCASLDPETSSIADIINALKGTN